MEIKDMIALMEAVSNNGLTAFELEQGDMRLSMKREKKQAAVPIMGRPGDGAEDFAKLQPEDGGGVKNREGATSDKVVTCPLVGTFYSSPSPDAEDFVKVGDRVKKGQIIGIVEAMKLMNEIECEYDGIVEAVLVRNEETVEYGQPLFRIH
ncbi:acetyl-CoA carboxylase biotin carboxyl carrier protein [Lachnospiraceae bacterium 45-P1]